MSLTPQFIFYSHLPLNKPCYAVRNSDDFFPNEPSSHTWHVFCNAHVSVLTQHLNVLPDWDMFQTKHVWSGFHAAARCISGGPIYFTDEPGEHDLGMIDQMTAQAATSRIILRPDVGKSTQVYAGHLDPVLCKLGTYWSPEGIVGSVILGVFNVGCHSLSEFLSLRAFPKIQPGQAFVIRAHTSGEISRRVTLHEATPAILIDMPQWGHEILTAFPLLSFPIPGGGTTEPPTIAPITEIAILGLLHKMTGVAAVTRVETKLLGGNEQTAQKPVIRITLKALGILGWIFPIYPRPSDPDFSLLNMPFLLLCLFPFTNNPFSRNLYPSLLFPTSQNHNPGLQQHSHCFSIRTLPRRHQRFGNRSRGRVGAGYAREQRGREMDMAGRCGGGVGEMNRRARRVESM